MNKLLALLAGLVAATVLTFAVASSAQPEGGAMKLAHGLPESHPVHKAMAFFADQVEERSQGRLRVDIFANGQLGQERELMELLQMGAIDMIKSSTATMETFDPVFSVFSLPFIFESQDHYYRFLNSGKGQQLLNAASSLGLTGLTYYSAGARSLYTNKAINHPDDLKGMKIRVQMSPTAVALMNALGATPTSLDWGEVYTALQTKVVDGAENNVPSYVSSRHQEVAPYFAFNEHQMVPDVLLANTQFWESLSEEDRALVKQAALDSFDYQKELWAAAEGDDMVLAKESGALFSQPDKAPFMEKTRPLVEAARKNPATAEVLDSIAAQAEGGL